MKFCNKLACFYTEPSKKTFDQSNYCLPAGGSPVSLPCFSHLSPVYVPYMSRVCPVYALFLANNAKAGPKDYSEKKSPENMPITCFPDKSIIAHRLSHLHSYIRTNS
jgi:hypothetical protein